MQKQFLSELGEDQPISGRKSYYGQVIINIINGTKDNFEYSPREIAYALHIFYSLPINNVDIQLSNKKLIEQNSEKMVGEFYSSIKTIFLKIYPKERKINPSSHSIHITSGSNIHSRINDKKII